MEICKWACCVRDCIDETRAKLGIETDHFVIDPCPSYLDGYDRAYGLYCAGVNGSLGECIALADGESATWELYKLSMELFGYAMRGPCWSEVNG